MTSWFSSWEADKLESLRQQEGENWRERHCIRFAPSGEYHCDFCWKELQDLGRVLDHIKTVRHINKVYAEDLRGDPLSVVPAEQRQFCSVRDGFAFCQLCWTYFDEAHAWSSKHMYRITNPYAYGWQPSAPGMPPQAPHASQPMSSPSDGAAFDDQDHCALGTPPQMPASKAPESAPGSCTISSCVKSSLRPEQASFSPSEDAAAFNLFERSGRDLYTQTPTSAQTVCASDSSTTCSYVTSSSHPQPPPFSSSEGSAGFDNLHRSAGGPQPAVPVCPSTLVKPLQPQGMPAKPPDIKALLVMRTAQPAPLTNCDGCVETEYALACKPVGTSDGDLAVPQEMQLGFGALSPPPAGASHDKAQDQTLPDLCSHSYDETHEQSHCQGSSYLQTVVVHAYDGVEKSEQGKREGGYLVVKPGDRVLISAWLPGHMGNRFDSYVFGHCGATEEESRHGWLPWAVLDNSSGIELV